MALHPPRMEVAQVIGTHTFTLSHFRPRAI